MAETRQPEEIRSDIEETREQLGETVEALAAKADVKGQAKAKVEDVKTQVREKPAIPAGAVVGIAAVVGLVLFLRSRR